MVQRGWYRAAFLCEVYLEFSVTPEKKGEKHTRMFLEVSYFWSVFCFLFTAQYEGFCLFAGLLSFICIFRAGD